MNNSEDNYDQFISTLHTNYPDLFESNYGGVETGEGWWPLIESLCKLIHHHVKTTNERRELLLEDNPYNLAIPDEIEKVKVLQIKEKFGGLRFYYNGGDEFIDGAVRLAELISYKTCETCGNPGSARTGGWVKTLCETHHQEREERKAKQ
jgi:hypothetical protein